MKPVGELAKRFEKALHSLQAQLEKSAHLISSWVGPDADAFFALFDLPMPSGKKISSLVPEKPAKQAVILLAMYSTALVEPSSGVLIYKPPKDGGVSYTPVAPGGLPRQWRDYIISQTSSYNEAREAYFAHYPKWESQLEERRRAGAADYAKHAAAALENEAQLAEWKKSADGLIEVDKEVRAQFKDLPEFSEPDEGESTSSHEKTLDALRELISAVLPSDEDQMEYVRMANVWYLAARFAFAAGKEAVGRVQADIAAQLLGMASPELEHKRFWASLTPGVNVAQDIYELAAKYNIEQQRIDLLDRGWAALGIATFGFSSEGKAAIKALSELIEASRAGKVAESFAEGAKIAEEALREGRIAARGRGWRDSFAIKRTIKADELNAEYLKLNPTHDPPHLSGSIGHEIEPLKNTRFVRVHGKTNKERPWLMRKENIIGLTPKQIQNKYNLPEVPTLISDVEVPAGTSMIRSRVGPNQFGKSEGAIQYKLEQDIPESNFCNTRPIGEKVEP